MRNLEVTIQINMKMKLPFFLFAILLAGLWGCNESDTPEMVQGLRPIYGTPEELAKLIRSDQPLTLKQVGKIYTRGNLLFINEVNKGVHVFDNIDPKNPIKLKFIHIPGNIDVAVKGNYLFADMGAGLVTIDITDIHNVAVTDIDNNYVSEINQVQPPQNTLDLLRNGKIYFECADRSKGPIVSWELVEMPKPQCYINN
jgi:hypothetical protein